MFMQKILKISAFFLLANCALGREGVTEKTTEIFAKKGMISKIYPAKNFEVFTSQKILDSKQDLRVYLEGDGKAFIFGEASQDPTPTSYFLANLISKDDFPNILYIARPCQYVVSEKCEEKYWTEARFAPEIIDAIDEVLRQFSDKKIQVIGYSGGAAVAQYLAARHNNIVSIRTIAGNLNHEKFCDIHAVPRLQKSMPSERNFGRLEKIPQIHFVGTKDKIVPPAIAKEYLNKLSHKNCAQVFEIEGATHSSKWQEKWGELVLIEPKCI